MGGSLNERNSTYSSSAQIFVTANNVACADPWKPSSSFSGYASGAVAFLPNFSWREFCYRVKLVIISPITVKPFQAFPHGIRHA